MKSSPGQWLLAVVLVMIVWSTIPATIVSGPQVRVKVTVTQMGALKSALEMFKDDNGFLPPNANGLKDLIEKPTNASSDWHQYFDKIPNDFWGHPYRYENPGTHNTNAFDLSSAGPDGIFGTADDIVNWPK